MDALGAGAVDLPERQHTLRATVEWSVAGPVVGVVGLDQAVAGQRVGQLERVAQICSALGEDRFEEVFAAGAPLNRREAVAALRDRGGTGTRVS